MYIVVLPVAGERVRAFFRVRLFRLSAVRAILCGDYGGILVVLLRCCY